ncbi:MAG: hypothetical protein RIF32_19260, partial [Leptospirales bacterium]
VVSLEPAGLKFDCENGAELSLAIEGVRPDSTVLMTRLDEESGRWVLDGTARVNFDGSRLRARIHHCSLYAPVMPTPVVEVLDESSDTAGADGLKGALLLDLPLPSFRIMNQSVQPGLSYSSMAAAPQVILTGVFRGLREIEHVENLPPASLENMLRGQRVDVHIQANAYRDPNFLESLFLKRIQVQSASESFTAFIPEGDVNPYARLPTRRTEKDYYIEYDNRVTSTPLIFQKIQFTTATDISTKFWPAAISGRYYFGFLESESKKIYGPAAMKGPAGDEREAHVLPANFSVALRVEPVLPSGDYYPTGLYSYLARFSVEAEGFRTIQSSTKISDFYVDRGFRAHLTNERDRLQGVGGRTPDQEAALGNLNETLNALQQMEIAHAQDSVYSENVSSAQWLDPFDMLNTNQAGNVIVYNLSRSAFGRGWYPTDLQRLYPLGHSRALIAGPAEKIVFSLNHTIDKLIDLQATRFARMPDSNQLAVAGREDLRVVNLNDASVVRETQSLESLAIHNEQRRTRLTRAWRPTGGYTDWFRVITECRKFLWWKFSCRTRREFDRREYHYAWLWKDEGESAPAQQRVQSFPPEIADVVADQEGNVYIADVGTHRIYRMDAAGEIVPVCGRTKPVNTITRTVQHFDSGNHEIESVPGSGNVRQETTTLARAGQEPGTDFSPDGTTGIAATIHTPAGLAVDADGNLVFSEQGWNRIRRLSRRTGQLETVAGNGEVAYDPARVKAKEAALPAPSALATDAVGNIFAAINLEEYGSQIIVKIDPHGNITRFAGSPAGTVTPGVSATLFKIVDCTQMTVDANGHLYFVSAATRKAYRISREGFVDEIAGTGKAGALPGDGGPALQANLNLPRGIQATANGDVLLLDAGHESLRRIPGSILSPGPVQMRAPAGHFDSKLERDASGVWTRIFRNGVRVFFDADGRQTRNVDRNGNETLFTYDSRGEIERIAYPAGAFLEFRYDSRGKLASVIDHLGRETTIEIPEQDLIRANLPDGRRLEFEYLPDGKLLSKEES